MHLRLVVTQFVLLLIIAGCSSSNAGLYAFPVRLIALAELSLPAEPLYAGEPAEFGVSWVDGREPFSISWSFGNGSDPPLISTIENSRAHSVWVTPLNDGDTPASYSGSVVITDEHLNEVSAGFTYTVHPAR